MVQIAASRPQPRFDGRRAQILRRAAGAFRRRGFHGTGMRDIARALGMTPGALYYYFRGKRDLLYFCQRHSLGRLLDAERSIVSGPGREDEKIRALLRAHLETLLDETGGSAAHLEFLALPASRRPWIAAQRDAYERRLRRLIASGVRSGVLRAVDPKLASLAILGAVNWTVVWYRPTGPRKPSEIAASFADTLVRGLLA